MKWFDFADSAAKLERVRTGPGHHVLLLEMSAESPILEETTPDELEMYGWITREVVEGRISFENHRAILKAADVAQSLLVFWPEQVIREAHRPVNELIQGERIEGLKTRDMATMDDFEQDMVGVDGKDVARIKASILRAQSKVREMEKQVVAQPLGGRGLEIADKVHSIAGPGLAVASVIDAIRPHKTPALEEVMVEIADADSDRLPVLVEKLGSLVSEHIVDVVERHVDQYMASDQIMTNGQGSRYEAALGMLRHSTPVLALEQLRTSPKPTAELEADLGMSVRRDKSLPTAQYRHSLISMRVSLEAMADALNRDPRSVVPGQGGVVLRVSRKSAMADERKLGVRASVSVDASGDDDDLDSVSAVAVSATYGGAFVHETGHLVESAYNITVEERKDILESSGVRGRAFRAVRDALDKELIDDKMAEYLRSDTEIFARTFEAAILNRALQRDDRSLKDVGGFSAGFPGDEFSPVGDPELTEKFLTGLNELLDQKQALKHEKRQVVTASVEP